MPDQAIPEGLPEDLHLKLTELHHFADQIPAVLIVHELASLEVIYMSPSGLKQLGITASQLREMGGAQYYKNYFNQEDATDYIPKVTGLLDRNSDDVVTFFQQVRLSQDKEWIWHLTCTKIFLRNAEGLPTHIISVACTVDPLHHITSKVNRLLEENNFLRRSKHIFASLTKKEIDVLRLIATGHNSKEIAAKLYIAEQTALTHRRNIRNKLSAKSDYDITRFAQAFDLI